MIYLVTTGVLFGINEIITYGHNWVSVALLGFITSIKS